MHNQSTPSHVAGPTQPFSADDYRDRLNKVLAAAGAEAVDALLVQDGKILYVGVSNFEIWELAPALQIIAERRLAKIAVFQIRHNLLHRTHEGTTLPLASAAGIGVVSYNPLGGGILGGRFQRGQEIPAKGRFAQPIYQQRYWSERTFDMVDVLAEVSRIEGFAPAQVALAWLLTKSVTTPLVGARNPDQITAIVKAVDMILSPESIVRLDQASASFA